MKDPQYKELGISLKGIAKGYLPEGAELLELIVEAPDGVYRYNAVGEAMSEIGLVVRWQYKK